MDFFSPNLCYIFCVNMSFPLLQVQRWLWVSKHYVSKVGGRSRGRPEGSLFNSHYTEVLERALYLYLDHSTLPLIRTLYCWVLSKEISSTILKFWYNVTWDWTQVSLTIGEHSTYLANDPVTNIMSSLSSSCRAASMDIPGPLSQLLPIVHRLWQVFRATSCIVT